MIKNLLLLIILVLINAKAFGLEADWYFKSENGYTYLMNKKDKSLKQIVPVDPGGPHIEKVIEKKEGVPAIIIIYYSGEVGTFEVYKHYRAVIYKPKKKSFELMTHFYRSEFAYSTRENTKQREYQTKWEFKKDKIIIKDPFHKTTKTISLVD